MSSLDPNVSDLGEDDLSRIADLGGTTALPAFVPAKLVTHFQPDPAADNGERFIFALAFEGKSPSSTATKSTERMFFPVNPEEFSWTQNRQMGTYDILNGPQATQLGAMQVRVFQMSVMFPYLYEADFCIPYPRPQLDKDPQASRDWLHLAQKAGAPLEFYCIPLRPKTPIIFPKVKVVISSLATSYRAGNPLDVFVELELTELVEPTIIRTATSEVITARYDLKKRTTRRGDTLMHIARLAYGVPYAPQGWKLIKAKNKWVLYPHHKRHRLRNNKGKTSPMHSNTPLLTGQHLVIPPPKNQPR